MQKKIINSIFFKAINVVAFCLFAFHLNAQSYWNNVDSEYLLGESHAIIKCADGGYASTGSHSIFGQFTLKEVTTTKFDKSGNTIWRASEILETGFNINIGIVEVKEDLFVVTSDYFGQKSIITRYDKDGQLFASSGELDMLVNEIFITADNKLLVQYSKGLNVFIGCLTLDFEMVWEVEMENVKFSLIDGFGMIDDMDNYQCILAHKDMTDRALHYIISPDGIVLRSEEFSLNINTETGSGGVCFDYLDDNTIVTLPQGNLVGGEIHLSKIDLETYEILDSFFVYDYITFSEEIMVINEMIYVAGAARSSDFLGFLILDSDFEFIDMIQFESKISDIDATVKGAEIYDMVDTGEGILYCGTVFQGGTSHGYLDGHIGYNGECTSLSLSDDTMPVDLRLYPNPTTDNVNLSFGEHTYVKSINVYSALGELLKQVDIHKSMLNYEFDVSEFNESILLIEVYLENGLLVKKLFKLD